MSITNYKPIIGYYWIDPNEGSSKDAVKVFCRGSETCLESKKSGNNVMIHSDVWHSSLIHIFFNSTSTQIAPSHFDFCVSSTAMLARTLLMTVAVVLMDSC